VALYRLTAFFWLGLVRFISPKSAKRAIDKFEKEEIVVQDVGVMVKILRPAAQSAGGGLASQRMKAPDKAL